jgi:hypothetical protein
MAWNNLVSPLAVTTRRRVIASAILYGLSLSVRFTSAAGEEVQILPQSVQRPPPVISLMARSGSQLPYQEWISRAAQPIFYRHGWSAGSTKPGCFAP